MKQDMNTGIKQLVNVIKPVNNVTQMHIYNCTIWVLVNGFLPSSLFYST